MDKWGLYNYYYIISYKCYIIDYTWINGDYIIIINGDYL